MLINYCLGLSLVVQVVKDLPAIQKTQVQSLGSEDTLEKEMAAHSSALAWRIPGTGSLVGCRLQGRTRLERQRRFRKD